MDGNISQTISRNNGDAEEEEDSEQEGNAGCNGRLTITDDIQRAAGVYITSGTSQEGHTTWPTKSQAEEGDAHVTNAEQTSLQARHGDGPECDPTGPTGTFVQTLTSPQKIADNTAPNSSAVTAQGPQPTEFVPTSTTASAESNYCYLPEAKISRQTLAPSSGSRDSRSNYICDNNQRPSVLETSVNNGTRKPSSESALSLFRTEPGNPVHKDGTTGASRNISVIDVTRESSVIKGRIKYADGKFPGVHSSMSSRSREISHQRDQILTSLVEGGQEPQADTGETITADIPQSLSTDSGIGSPPDGRTDIDPGVSLDMELGKDGKWKVENCPANSLAPRLVPSISYDRSENYRPCVEQSDAPSLSSPGDTSNYLSTLAPAHGQSIPGDGSSSHDSTLLDSLKTDEKRSLESDSRERLKENDVNLINTETILTTHFMSINHPENNSSLTEELAKTGQIIARKRNFGSDVEQNLDSSTCAGEEGSVATNISLTPEFAAELDTLDPVITTREKKSVLSSSSLSSASIESQSSSSKLLPDKGDVSHSLQYDQVREKFTKAVNNLHLTGQLPAAVTGSQVSGPDIVPDLTPPGRKVKGILKATSAPTFSVNVSRAVTLAEGKNGDAKGEITSPRSVSFKKTHTKNTFSYNNAAFEGEIITEPCKRASLAEVVSQIMRQSSIVDMEEDNSHPYGRDNSLSDLMTGKQRDNIHMDAGKMIVWLALAIMIVSLAGGIIFMSETYNRSHKDMGDVLPDYDFTTPDSPS